MTIVGIDPGQKGGAARMSHDGVFTFRLRDMQQHGYRRLLALWLQHPWPDIVLVESGQYIPKNGRQGAKTFNEGVGMVLGICSALNISSERVSYTDWQKVIIPNAEPKKTKDASIQFVKDNYPTVDLFPGNCTKEHDGIADAVCIAEYGRRVFGGGE